MSALDHPTADELARGTIAAAVRNGELTPQEAQALARELDDPSPRFVRAALRSGADLARAMAPRCGEAA